MKPSHSAVTFSRAALLLVLGAVFLVYFPVLGNGFVNWEDDIFVVQNPYFRQLGLPNLVWMFASHLVGTYQPLCWLLWAGIYRAWGLAPGVFHAVSLGLHLAMTAGVFLLAGKLLSIIRPGGGGLARTSASAIAALFFALHPLQVEIVAVAGVQGDILSSFFFVFSILAYLESASGTRPSRGWLRLSWALAFCAGLSRWHVAALPLILIALDFYPLRRLGDRPREWVLPAARRVWLEKIPFLLIAGLFVLINALAKSQMGHYEGEAGTIFDSLSAVMFYPWKLVWIGNLLPVYLLSAPVNESPWSPVLGIPAFVVATAVLIRSRKRWPAGLTAWVCYLAMIAPPLSVFFAGRPLFGHDRYAYLACLPFFLLAAGGLEACLKDAKPPRFSARLLALPAAALLLFFFGLRTRRQVLIWRSSEDLWRHVLSVDPRSKIGIYRMGGALVDEGRFDESIRLFEDQMIHDPRLGRLNLASAHIAKGLSLLNAGRHDEAKRQVREALRHDPDIPKEILRQIEAAAKKSRK